MASLMDIANQKLGAPSSANNMVLDPNNSLMSIAQSKLGTPSPQIDINNAPSAPSAEAQLPSNNLVKSVRNATPIGVLSTAMKAFGNSSPIASEIGNRSQDFLYGGNSGYGMAGNITRTLPVGELGATSMGLGAVAKGAGLGGDALTKIGEMISPLTARTMTGALGKTAFSGGLSSGVFTAGENASQGQPITNNLASNTAIGAIASPILGLGSSYTARAGLNVLDKAKPLTNYIRNLAGGSNVNEIDKNALDAVNKAGEINSKISSDHYYEPLWDITNARNISAGAKPNLTEASDQLYSQAKELGSEYHTLKEDIKTAPELAVETPRALHKRKSYYKQQERKAVANQDGTAAHYYNKLADAADKDITHALYGTGLSPMLDRARAFHSKYVIPLRQFQEAGMVKNTDKLHEVLKQPEGQSVLEALTPSTQYPEHMMAHAALSQSMGTTPKNIVKAAILAKGALNPETSRIDPETVLKKYSALSKVAPHLKNKLNESSSLFNLADMSKLSKFARDYGVNTDKVKPSDLAYLATEVATHAAGGLPYKASRTASAVQQLSNIAGAGRALNNPEVFEAGLRGNTLGMQRKLQQIRNLRMMQAVSPFVAGVSGLLGGQQ